MHFYINSIFLIWNVKNGVVYTILVLITRTINNGEDTKGGEFKMLKFKKEEVKPLAIKIASNNPEMFPEEIDVGLLMCYFYKLLNSANKFGCDMEGSVCIGKGKFIQVAAMPKVYQSSWEF